VVQHGLLVRSQRVWASPPLQPWPRRPSDRRSRPARCPPPWPTRAGRPAWGSRSAAAGAPARRRRLRRRHGQRLRADSGRGLPRPRRSDPLPQAHARAGRVPGGDRHPGVMRTRGARLGARPARDPAVRRPQRSLGHHRPSAGGRPLLHPMQGADLRRRYLHVHRRADPRGGFRGRTNIAPSAPAGGRAPGRCDRGRARRPPPANDGHAPGVAPGSTQPPRVSAHW